MELSHLSEKIDFQNIDEEIKRGIKDLFFNQKVEAIYFTNNTLATRGLKAMFRMGIHIPDDVDVMAFDKSEAYNFLEYPVPHVSQPIREMGLKAVELLIDQFDGKNGNKIQKVLLETKIEVNQHIG